jgi:hypothetical protein
MGGLLSLSSTFESRDEETEFEMKYCGEKVISRPLYMGEIKKSGSNYVFIFPPPDKAQL